MAKSGWCIFLDCDDYLIESKAREMLTFLSNSRLKIVMFHCTTSANEDDSSNKDRFLNLKKYASHGTGEEALTAINKEFIKRTPYFGQLRGYEGLGIIRAMEYYQSDLYFSSIKSRVYTADSPLQLSKGQGFDNRLKYIIKGHIILLKKYGMYITLQRKAQLVALIIFYSIKRWIRK